MYVVCAIVIAILLWKTGLDINYSLVVLGLGVAVQSIPARFRVFDIPKRAKGTTRAEAEKWMREQGYLPQTPEEAREEIREEKATFNKNEREIAVWSGSQTYRDADGCQRDVVTRKPI